MFEFTDSPQAADIDFLTQRINEETPAYGQATPFAFFLRDANRTIIAGANGSVIFGVIYTDQLWVDPLHRTRGLGKQLMVAVHAYGKSLGCRLATVNTMSFQAAEGFYQKLGYAVDFERSGYAAESRCLFMQKGL